MTTKIDNNLVVSFHYTLKNDTGDVIDQSTSGEPLAYLHGAGNIVPGLENALTGKAVGDKLSVHVPAAQAYGEYDPNLVQSVPLSNFQGVEKVEVGMQFYAQTEDGPQVVTIKTIEGDEVIVDGNFPLAGQDLNFDVEIVEIREATETELEHGHVHGAGCNHDH